MHITPLLVKTSLELIVSTNTESLDRHLYQSNSFINHIFIASLEPMVLPPYIKSHRSLRVQ